MDPITENPNVNSIEVWEMHNFTMDAHPIHIHLVQFQVVDRQPFGGIARPPEVWEIGFKDTVICYPGEVTRVKASFDIAGLYVWHCHIIQPIIEHRAAKSGPSFLPADRTVLIIRRIS
jgi:FtsP/CotA-like multicopper oxidase with cupredoxin domain